LLAGEQSLAQTYADERDIGLAEYRELAALEGGWRFSLGKAQYNWPRLAPPLAALGPGPWIHEYLRYLDAAAAWSKLPWRAAPPPRPSRVFALPLDGPHALQPLVYRFLSARCDAQDEMFLAALALQAWRAEHGRYPDALDALVPDVLEALPPDPFGRGPLNYRRDGDKYVLYSAGPDGADDGGHPAVWRDEETGELRYNTCSPDSRGDLVWVTSAVLSGERP
jgi:hypothetical protein